MSVDLCNWTVQAYESKWSPSNWQVREDGLSVSQSVNGGASLFCSDFPATGSNLEGEIMVASGGRSDDDFIGFAFGYNIGDNMNLDANWHLVDWKKRSQALPFSDRYCRGNSGTGSVGFAISEIKGIPVWDEFWEHTNLASCNDAGGVTEIQRGINYASIGWDYDTTYQFRFEVSSEGMLAFVNGQLELNVTGSFDITGSFCYYNLSQDRVRYSGLTRQTENPSAIPTDTPSARPSTNPTESPSASPSGHSQSPSNPPSAPSIETSPPLCEVKDVTEDGIIMLQASNSVSNITSVALNPPSADVSLTYTAQRGDETMEIDLSIDYLSESTDFRSSKVVVTNEDGLFCSFPSIGSILDDDCGQNEDCLPDDAIEFPLSSSIPGVPIFNFDNATILAQPAFGRIVFNGTTLRYVPTWIGIQYDAFAIESRTIAGDTIFFSASYNGTDQTVEVDIDILGFEDVEYYTEDDTLDDVVDSDGELRARRLRSAPLPIEYQHIVPQGVFGSGKNAYKIDGLDRNFLNRIESKQFGVLLRREDHRGKNAIVKPLELNKMWDGWVVDFRDKNGRLPVKNEVLTQGFQEITADPKVRQMLDAGIPNPDYSYNQWNNKKYREYKVRMLEELDSRARSRAKINPCSSGRFNPCKALKRASKLPVVGRFIGLGVFANEVLLQGRPIAEAAVEFGLDAIPVWGEIRGAYSLAQDLCLFERFGLKVDAGNLETLIWKTLRSDHGIKEVLGPNDFGISKAYLDPHFCTFNENCYAYHGVCDMVFLRNALVEIHIRTKSLGRRHWSSLSGIAMRIGNDTLEMDDNAYYYLNGESLASGAPPVALAGSFPFSVSSSGVGSLQLSGGQFIQLSQFGTVLNLQVHGHGSDFRDSNGMSGKWDRLPLIGRDGLSVFENTTEFAMEWEINASKGDLQLFREAAQSSCREPGPRPEPDVATLELARTACANILDDVLNENCVFDVTSTGDVSFAQSEIYTEPLQSGGVCASSSEDCELRGGSCVWRCDTATSNCLPDLCSLVQSVETFENESETAESLVDGCSCEIPFANEPTAFASSAPSSTPTPVPTSPPSLVPTTSPTPVPTSSPTPVPTSSPTPVPTLTPSSVPTLTPTPVPTSTPTVSFTSAPNSASCVPSAFWSGRLCLIFTLVMSLQLF
ncbi:unnamed protein product [Cylindrotheca closterium]|uniref:TSP C-terminal domain-containing protein n=1 Tax=Cylindrotheca closterium TaxID=2856 RepID=A0AAD2JGK4_9STRA|nr:unnamed protein product [Cylindrotheca closterium]